MVFRPRPPQGSTVGMPFRPTAAAARQVRKSEWYSDPGRRTVRRSECHSDLRRPPLVRFVSRNGIPTPAGARFADRNAIPTPAGRHCWWHREGQLFPDCTAIRRDRGHSGNAELGGRTTGRAARPARHQDEQRQLPDAEPQLTARPTRPSLIWIPAVHGHSWLAIFRYP